MHSYAQQQQLQTHLGSSGINCPTTVARGQAC